MEGAPKPNEHHRRLHKLAGTWVGAEQLHPSPWSPGGTRTGRYDHQVRCDGFFVIGDYVQMGDDNAVTYAGHSVFGVDPATREVTWYWVDSMGHPPPSPSRGNWEGDTLLLHGRDGKGALHGRYTFAFEGNDRFRFQLENTRDGGQTWQPFMEATYRRTA